MLGIGEYMSKKVDIDSLFDEKDICNDIPDEIIAVIKKIIERNSKYSFSSRRRVSKKRAVKWIKEEFNYPFTEWKMDKVMEKLNRRSWAYE